jgi:C-terminal processing protease CtpA/Prc
LGVQHTQGALSDAIPKTLPNGWEFTLSIEVLTDARGQRYEVRGIQPDVLETPYKWTQNSHGKAILQALASLEADGK